MEKTRKSTSKVKYTSIAGEVSSSQWSQIFSAPWPDSLRHLIAYMFEYRGYGSASAACMGVPSQVPRANRVFIKHNLPFRIRSFTFGGHTPVDRRDKSWFSTQGLKLYLVTRD